MNTTLKIGAVAKQAGVHVQTIHYYEKEGLLPVASRSAAGYRLYAPDTVHRLLFIRHAQEIGFSLKEIRDLLSLRVDAHMTCGDVKARAEQKLVEVQHKIERLQTVRGALEGLIASCEAEKPAHECALLEALDAEHFSVRTT